MYYIHIHGNGDLEFKTKAKRNAVIKSIAAILRKEGFTVNNIDLQAREFRDYTSSDGQTIHRLDTVAVTGAELAPIPDESG